MQAAQLGHTSNLQRWALVLPLEIIGILTVAGVFPAFGALLPMLSAHLAGGAEHLERRIAANG